MFPASIQPFAAGTDPRVQAFLEAPDGAGADRALACLLATATTIIDGFLQRKAGSAAAEAEDIASEARLQIATRLHRLRLGLHSPAACPSQPPIADLDAYARAVAYTAWAQALRTRSPARAQLLNRLQYLLENRTNQRGFALWQDERGERQAGFALWRTEPPRQTPQAAERLQRLAADPVTAATLALGPGPSSWPALGLPALVAGLLRWLGTPLPLRELTDALAAILRLPVGTVPLADEGAADEPLPAALIDAQPSPHDALRWKEALRWLWLAVGQLTLRQRRAFLLHSTCLWEMETLGLTSIRQAAATLELTPERMAELWNDLPLEDRLIADLLRVENQQVINLRKVARGILGRAWARWLHDGN